MNYTMMFNLFSCSSLYIGNLNDRTRMSDWESDGLFPTEEKHYIIFLYTFYVQLYMYNHPLFVGS